MVRRQAESGLDVVTDGEQGKVSFLTYVKERLAGFDQVEGETAAAALVAAGDRRLPRVLPLVHVEVLLGGRRR